MVLKIFNLKKEKEQLEQVIDPNWIHCRLDTSACNNKQRWSNDKCRCECARID